MKHKLALRQIEKCHDGEIAAAGEHDNPFENGHVGRPEAELPSMSRQRVRPLAGRLRPDPLAGDDLLFDAIVPGKILSRVAGVDQRMATWRDCKSQHMEKFSLLR